MSWGNILNQRVQKEVDTDWAANSVNKPGQVLSLLGASALSSLK